MSLVLMYAVYICVMYFNQKLETLFDKVVTKCCPRHYTKDTSNPEERQALLASSETGKYDSTGPADPKKSDVDQTADLMESNVDQTEKYEGVPHIAVNHIHGTSEIEKSGSSTETNKSADGKKKNTIILVIDAYKYMLPTSCAIARMSSFVQATGLPTLNTIVYLISTWSTKSQVKREDKLKT